MFYRKLKLYIHTSQKSKLIIIHIFLLNLKKKNIMPIFYHKNFQNLHLHLHLHLLLFLFINLSRQQTQQQPQPQLQLQQINLIKNGGFDFPILPIYDYMIGDVDCWTGNYIQLDRNVEFDGTMNQFIDMQAGYYQNGFLEQTVTLDYSTNCTISYKQRAESTNYALYGLKIYWNYQLLATKIANTTSITVETFQVYSIVGLNVLIFKEVGDSSDLHGMYIDDVVLYCASATLNVTNATISNTSSIPEHGLEASKDESLLATYHPLSDPEMYSLNAILALPFRSKNSLRSIYFIFDDFWLYNYDKRQHFGVVNEIFNTITLMQLMKFRFLQNFLGFAKYAQSLPLSNYTDYTLNKFVEIEGSESVLITSNFTFFIYSIPQNLVFSFLLYATFIMISQRKVSKHLRVYYFSRAVLAQNLIEANLSYLVYICFSHLSHSFSQRFGDKFSLNFTVCFFFFLVVFFFTFYFMLTFFLGKYSGYFIYSQYRFLPGISMLMIERVVRAFLQGAAHFFLYNHYMQLMIVLSCIQAVVIILMIVQENRRKIFVSSIAFCLVVFYHFLFVCFNCSLYFEYLCSYHKYEGYEQLRDLALAVEEVIVKIYFCVFPLMLVNDILPKKSLVTKKKHGKKLTKENKSNQSLKITQNPTEKIAKIKQEQSRSALNPSKRIFHLNQNQIRILRRNQGPFHNFKSQKCQQRPKKIKE